MNAIHGIEAKNDCDPRKTWYILLSEWKWSLKAILGLYVDSPNSVRPKMMFQSY